MNIYKHNNHAGNHADTLKHLCLIYFLKSIKKPYNSISYIDTHAGNGLYKLDDNYIKKNEEYQNGISKLLIVKTKDPYIRFYIKTINNINQSSKIKFYPGSPKIVQHLTNKKDELYFFELIENEYKSLQKNFSKYSNIKIIKNDGFDFFKSIKINKEKNGVILIDPVYKNKDDYLKVINLVKNYHIQFENKIVIIWYPVLDRIETNNFIDEFKRTGIQNILRIEMPIQNDNSEKDMTGSGLIIINSHKKTAQSIRGTIIELQSILQFKDNKKKVIVNNLK